MVLLVGSLGPVAHGAADTHARVRGMTVSCHGAGLSWGSDAMVGTIAELGRLGVNWIAIHPYAGIRRDGTVTWDGARSMYRDATWLTRPIAEAHRHGLKIMIKPHLAYWGSGFSWRGEIAFDTADEWARFFESYERWIVAVAEITAEADAFAVGTELDLTVGHEAAWREIVTAVREKTDAPLTYSASWNTFEEVGFWDALDAIGIQGYFPLVDHETLPTRPELDAAWRELIDRLEAYGQRHRRDVILGELGYNRSAQAALTPWAYGQGGEHAEETQRRCLEAALAAIDRSEVVSGAFLWKWFPGDGNAHGNFLKSTPAMREVIERHWSPAASDARGAAE